MRNCDCVPPESKSEALKAKDPVRFRSICAVVTPVCKMDIFHFRPTATKYIFIVSSSVCSLQIVTPCSQRHWIQTWKIFNVCHEQLRESDFKTAMWSILSFTRYCASWKADFLQATRLTYLTSRPNFRDTRSSSTNGPTNQFGIKASNFGSKTIDTLRVFNLHAVSLLSRTGSIYVLILITVITLLPFLQRSFPHDKRKI